MSNIAGILWRRAQFRVTIMIIVISRTYWYRFHEFYWAQQITKLEKRDNKREIHDARVMTIIEISPRYKWMLCIQCLCIFCEYMQTTPLAKLENSKWLCRSRFNDYLLSLFGEKNLNFCFARCCKYFFLNSFRGSLCCLIFIIFIVVIVITIRLKAKNFFSDDPHSFISCIHAIPTALAQLLSLSLVCVLNALCHNNKRGERLASYNMQSEHKREGERK